MIIYQFVGKNVPFLWSDETFGLDLSFNGTYQHAVESNFFFFLDMMKDHFIHLYYTPVTLIRN